MTPDTALNYYTLLEHTYQHTQTKLFVRPIFLVVSSEAKGYKKCKGCHHSRNKIKIKCHFNDV